MIYFIGIASEDRYVEYYRCSKDGIEFFHEGKSTWLESSFKDIHEFMKCMNYIDGKFEKISAEVFKEYRVGLELCK